MQDQTNGKPAAWWQFGHVWLLIAGPAAVVVAGLATFYIAVARPDPVISEDYYRQGMELNKTLEAGHAAISLAPAVQARNHAATGVLPLSKSAGTP
jgi:hypothetical protein